MAHVCVYRVSSFDIPAHPPLYLVSVVIPRSRLTVSSELQPIASAMTQLLKDLDALLGTNVNYLLGRWLQRAQNLSTTPTEAANYRFNALNQITLWGPEGEINDYAAKHWSGLVQGTSVKLSGSIWYLCVHSS